MSRLESTISFALIEPNIDLAKIPQDRLTAMAQAGAEIVEIYRLLGKTKSNIVAEVLRHNGTFFEWDHYPPGDVYDQETHSQYYYHAHAVENRFAGEHGHFHTFLRPKGMPAGLKPADVPNAPQPEGENDALSHLIAVSMNPAGFPTRLFTVNRWVTGETWYAAQDVIAMLDAFKIDHTWPSWPTNRWINGMICLFWPQIVALIEARDRVVANYQADQKGVDIYEDRHLEVTSYLDISVEQQVHAVAQALLAADA